MGATVNIGSSRLSANSHGLAATDDVLHPGLGSIIAGFGGNGHIGVTLHIGCGVGIAHIAAAHDLAIDVATGQAHVGAALYISSVSEIPFAAVTGGAIHEVAAHQVVIDRSAGHGQEGIALHRSGAAVDRRATGNDLAVDGASSDGHARAAHSGSGALVIGQTAAHNGSRQRAGVILHSTGLDRIPSNIAAVDGHGRGAVHGGLGGSSSTVVGLSDTAADHTGQSALVHGNGAVALDNSSSLRLLAVSCLSLAAANQSAVLDGHVTIDQD